VGKTLAFLVAFTACSYTPTPVSDVPGEVCAADLQPPVPDSESNPNLVAPVVLQRVAPQADGSLIGKNTTTTVEAVVGEDGRAHNICVTSGDPTWGRAVARALRQWKFQPATLDGEPIAAKFTLTSNFRS
jgi:protein TonB